MINDPKVKRLIDSMFSSIDNGVFMNFNINKGESISTCPLSQSGKTKFCSLESFFSACGRYKKKQLVIGGIRTNAMEPCKFCKKCKQLEASIRGELVIDLNEYSIEIDESLMDEYTEGGRKK